MQARHQGHWRRKIRTARDVKAVAVALLRSLEPLRYFPTQWRRQHLVRGVRT